MRLRTVFAAASFAAVGFAPAALAECAPGASWSIAPENVTEGALSAEVGVLGADCANGYLVLTLVDAADAVVFEQAWPVTWFADNNGKLYEPEAMVSAVSPKYSGSTRDMAAAESLGETEWLIASTENYDRYRNTDGWLICFQSGHESGACIGYDPATGDAAMLTANGS